jgi:ribulose-phosphate 3-epimerase
MALIAPSLLAADLARLGEALRLIKEAGASMVHVDVMDGHFVPEITVGQPVIKSLRKATDLVLDLHLLVERPERYAPEFVESGADRVAIHAEATPNLHKVLGAIRAGGAKAGLALNPSTTVESVADVLEDIDYLLILSADLGFPHPAFIPRTVSKVQRAGAFRAERRKDFLIQVEGSIGLEQVAELQRAGADILVAGSAIFQGGEPGGRLREIVRLGLSRQVSRV